MKPILIDALHITMGGGKVLLDYLCDRMIARGIDFVLLKDDRCGKLSCEDEIPEVIVLSASISARTAFYKRHKDNYTSVLCFANIPAPIKMPCVVHTYVHNVNLLKIPTEFLLKRKVMNWLKQRYIALLAANTQSWIVQTRNTEDCLRKVLPIEGKQIYKLPFYFIPDSFREMRCSNLKKLMRTDYVIVGDYTGTRGHDELLEGLCILKQKGITPCFHMTVTLDSPFARHINEAVAKGLNIINHGIVPFAELTVIYGKCKATVYPSINESLGLGIIEAVEAGCDVIASNLPFIHSICHPSEVFAHRTPEDIANAILTYEKGVSPKSELIIHDCVEELIALIKV